MSSLNESVSAGLSWLEFCSPEVASRWNKSKLRDPGYNETETTEGNGSPTSDVKWRRARGDSILWAPESPISSHFTAPPEIPSAPTVLQLGSFHRLSRVEPWDLTADLKSHLQIDS